MNSSGRTGTMSVNPFLDIDRQMVGDIYTTLRMYQNLEVLCDDLGGRFAGTPEERKAAEFIFQTMEEYGLRNVHFEEYSYQGWSRGPARLQIVEPFKREIRCISLPYCPAAEIEGLLVDVHCGTPEQYQETGDKLEGGLVMAHSRSPRAYGRWIHRKEKYARAVIGGARGFIFVGEHEGTGPETGSLASDRVGPIPGISIAHEDGALLQRLEARHGQVLLRLETTDTHKVRTSWNVVGEIVPEGEPPEEWIVLGCHYDGHDLAQGALDPASGLVVMLEAARVLARYAGGSLSCGVRFVAWGTEEIGLIGARRYVEKHQDELDQVRFYLNLDACGGDGRKGIAVHRWPGLTPFFERAAREMACELPVGQKVHASSDHFPFFLAGVPSGGIGDPDSTPSGRGFGHTAYDTLDKLELGNLRRAAAVASRLALRLAFSRSFPAKRRSQDAVERIVASDPGLETHRIGQALYAQME